MDHQKSTILLISGTLSIGGCGGHACYFQPKPRVISQLLSSWKHAESHEIISNSSELTQILKKLIALCPGRPCKMVKFSHFGTSEMGSFLNDFILVINFRNATFLKISVTLIWCACLNI